MQDKQAPVPEKALQGLKTQPTNSTTDRPSRLPSHSTYISTYTLGICLHRCKGLYLVPIAICSAYHFPSNYATQVPMALEISPTRLDLLCQESQQSTLLTMEWSFTIIAVFLLSLRLYCRTKFGKGLGWDDYAFGAGAVGLPPSGIGHSETCTDDVQQLIGLPDPFFVTKWVHTGLGKHIECLGPARAYATQQWSIAAQAHHIVCLGLVKVSLCLCILRVIDRVERRIATFLWVNIALVGAVHVAQLAMLLAECRPLNALWDLGVHGRCYSPSTAYTTTYIAFSKTIVTGIAKDAKSFLQASMHSRI